MKYFFTTLRHIELINFEEECFDIMPGIKITNNPDKITSFLNPEIINLIGAIEYQHIIESKAILFYEYEDKDIKEHFSEFSNIKLLELILQWIDDFLKNSWILKDNSIVCDTAYLIDTSDKANAECSSLRLNYIHSLSEGGIDITSFSKEEVKEVMKINYEIDSYLSDKDSNSLKFSMLKNYSRIGRYLFFIKYARESRNLGHKILNYCSALETLLSTDNSEISHKIGERTAFFLSDKFDKITTYRTIKKAYTVRSKLTHGANIDNKLSEEIFDISKNIDEILRMLINKIKSDTKLLALFESNNQVLNEYFNELLFS